MHARIAEITARIRARSAASRSRYLARIGQARRDSEHTRRTGLSCANLAHALAAAPVGDRVMLREQRQPNIAIVSSYNDMLSAHQPYAAYPELIKRAAREIGVTAQFAGGVPAMCDGITQGRAGMELSLFSRDVIAQATAVALSHDAFDAVLCLGVCDKIVPGLLIGALTFGHLPTVFVPAGPMASGLSNQDKARMRQRHAAGEVGRDALLVAEESAYHSPGTCTFYGTANSNQMLLEVMGLHLPGAAFLAPGSTERLAVTHAAVARVVARDGGDGCAPVGEIVSEEAIVNGIVALLATGGSTNHTLHLVAIARAAGIVIDWDDFDALSRVVPLLARIYPNGAADVNEFHAAGGVGYVVRELLAAGLLHESVLTVAGVGLARYTKTPVVIDDVLTWRASPLQSRDESILRPAHAPFSPDGGLKLLAGNLGRAVIKVSAVRREHRLVVAPARVFDCQQELLDAAGRGELDRDVVAVLRFQGPSANGMPELHGLTPTLANIQDQGFQVALVTDGRMSGASGKVPAAIHVSPECAAGGALAKLRDGDVVRVDADAGVLEACVAHDAWAARPLASTDLMLNACGTGRELFGAMRSSVSGAELGATTFGSSFAF